MVVQNWEGCSDWAMEGPHPYILDLPIFFLLFFCTFISYLYLLILSFLCLLSFLLIFLSFSPYSLSNIITEVYLFYVILTK